MPKANRFHNLKRPKIRQSWNKANLYNLSRLRNPHRAPTFFQQKWTAKAATSAYHAEHIKQRKWQKQFQATIKSVVPMDHRYLAMCDGSEQAAGRGSGRDLQEGAAEKSPTTERRLSPTPYMHMTFAPMERRLDTAIFRALFASSTRQARQFVVHGSVKVNGKKMIHPGYLLNPGDMFQVEPERVLFATGAPKDKENRSDGIRAKRRAREVKRNKKRGAQKKHRSGVKSKDVEAIEDEELAEPQTISAGLVQGSAPEKTPEEIQQDEDKTRRLQKGLFQDLLQHVRDVQSSQDSPSAKRKQELRTVMKTIRTKMSRMKQKTIDDVATDLNELMAKLTVAHRPKGVSVDEASREKGEVQNQSTSTENAEETPSNEQTQTGQPSLAVSRAKGELSPEQRDAVADVLAEARDNPYKPIKPYATPWTPRPYMSAFAFIPRYLEVNQNICSAVYLRHPVARPGLAEVPTPFAYETSQLAYLWYLRRR